MNYSERHVEKCARRLRSKGVRRLKRVQIFFLRLGFLVLLAGAGYGSYLVYDYVHAMIQEVPDIKTVEFNPTGTPSQVLDSDGEPVNTFSSTDVLQESIMLDKIPKDLQNAVIAAEDPRFWSHEGVDTSAVLRAYVNAFVKGGSFSSDDDTITQQLLKNQVFTGGDDIDMFARFRRRFQEMYLAFATEAHYTKDEILEYYLNTVSLGQNTLGVGAASKRYFNKQVSELTLPECATLAAIIKNPVYYNPITHASRNRKRELQVLTAMQDQGLITSDEYEKAIEDDVQTRIQRYNEPVMEKVRETSYYEDALKQEVIEDLKKELGYSDTQAMVALQTGGLIIHSTQDTELQQICDKVANNPANYPEPVECQLSYQLTIQHFNGVSESFNFNDIKKWYEENDDPIKSCFASEKEAMKVIRPFRRSVLQSSDRVVSESIHFIVEPQASIVLMDQSSGEIKALVGGRGEKTKSLAVNRSTDINRQPGSVFPTLSTYLPALDTAGMTLGTVQDDTEYNYPGTDQPVVNWYGDAYRGLITVRDAIQNPSNVVAVKTLDQVTPRVSYDYLRDLGINNLIDGYSDDAGQTYTDISLSLASGDLTKGVSNREITGAYATIAGGGVYHKPHLYTRIVDRDGNTIIDHTTMAGTRVMKETTAWLLTQTMLDEEQTDMATAGCGGSSEDGSDLWYIGYTPYITAGIWCGYDNSRSQDDTEYHQKIWRKVMKQINTAYTGVTEFKQPAGIVSATICTKCGKLAIEHLCEDAVGGSCARIEYFTEETLPTESCDCHVRCRICKSSGLLAGESCPDSEVSEVVYLQKKDETSDEGKTMDSMLIMPEYLINSICEVHNTVN
ncbi:MAG: transglycosylase domain-containing protein [Eubacterium sp.]|nr:transglycosylase domain-containing protein [Eubacterium sp.]